MEWCFGVVDEYLIGFLVVLSWDERVIMLIDWNVFNVIWVFYVFYGEWELERVRVSVYFEDNVLVWVFVWYFFVLNVV